MLSFLPQKSSIPACASSFDEEAQVSPVIPRKLWQTFFNYSPFDRLGESVQSWILQHRDFHYTLVSSEGADNFARIFYSNRPMIRDTFLETKHHILRADLLRYMLLESEGGVYSDVDTTLLRPFTEWIPESYTNDTRAIVGIEYDSLGAEPLEHGFPRPISFCQWTIAANKGHPMLVNAVKAVTQALRDEASAHKKPLGELRVEEQNVGRVTGPGIWTDVVFESLSIAAGVNVTAENITGLQEPRLFGDVLIMPINAFGTGQSHSGSILSGSADALVRHQFKMSWREQWQN